MRVPVVGANAGAKVTSLLAWMCAGADGIADMGIHSHRAMDTVLVGLRVPSTLGSFLRWFTSGHVCQLDAVASRILLGLAEQNPGLLVGIDIGCVIDIDNTVKPVYAAASREQQKPGPPHPPRDQLRRRPAHPGQMVDRNPDKSQCRRLGAHLSHSYSWASRDLGRAARIGRHSVRIWPGDSHFEQPMGD